MCPYLREGDRRNHCIAYLGDPMEPSCYEEEYLCQTCLHTMCVWYLSKNKQGFDGCKMCPVIAGRPMDEPEIADLQLLLN